MSRSTTMPKQNTPEAQPEEATTEAQQSDPKPEAGSLLLSARQVAALLNVSPATIWRLRDQGLLPPSVKVGSCVRWRRGDILRYVQGL